MKISKVTLSVLSGILVMTGCVAKVNQVEESSSSTGGGTSSIVVSGSSSSTGGGTSVASSGTPGTPLVYSSQTYKTVIIGTQTWMAQNLNVATSTGSWCYKGTTANCTTYGRLYNYATAKTVCPSGWHLPDTTEWNVLEAKVGGAATAGTKLKANSNLWSTNTGTDNYGFSALPGGYYSNGSFGYVGYDAVFWTATGNGSSNAWHRYMFSGYALVVSNYNEQSVGFSVRCLKGEAGGGTSSIVVSGSSSSTGGGTSVASSGTPGTPLVYSSQTYKTVIIGTQTWMAQNLNVATSTGSWCYKGTTANCTTYGRLYNYATAKTVCPSGWHLPDTTEWNVLEAKVGGTATAGTKLKANSNLWSTNTETDNYGFSALPAGFFSGSSFSGVGYYGYWWTATAGGSSLAWSRLMDYGDADVLHDYYGQTYGFSVRCLKDSN